MADNTLRGKAWVGGDHIYAFNIILQKRWSLDKLDPDELGKWVMEGVSPSFAGVENAFKNLGYTFIVAGPNFGGGGKSIEHPIKGLQGAGIKAVIAESFARLQFRNAINNGLPFMVCKGITEVVQMDDEIVVNLNTGEIKNLTRGREIQGAPIPAFVLEIAEAGGMIEYTRRIIADSKQQMQGNSQS